MQLRHHLRRFGIIVLIEFHCVPAVFAPVLPVLHHHIYRDLAFPELRGRIQNLLLTRVPFPALPESECPSGQHWNISGLFSVPRDHTVQVGTVNEVVIDRLACF